MKDRNLNFWPEIDTWGSTYIMFIQYGGIWGNVTPLFFFTLKSRYNIKRFSCFFFYFIKKTLMRVVLFWQNIRKFVIDYFCKFSLQNHIILYSFPPRFFSKIPMKAGVFWQKLQYFGRFVPLYHFFRNLQRTQIKISSVFPFLFYISKKK